MTVKEEKNRIISKLELISDSPLLEATELLISATGIDRKDLLFSADSEVGFFSRININRALTKRKKGIPLQYILGEWEFYSLPFKVGKGVLIPRAESEMLVDLALDEIALCDRFEVLDLCAGSGALGVAIKKNCPEARVTLVEKSKKAFKFLKKNVKLNDVEVKAILEDVADFIPENKADLIVCNPPYISKKDMKTLQNEVKKEPIMALYGGKDGLDFYRMICSRAERYLKIGGALFFEIGYDQAEDVSAVMVRNGFAEVQVTKDYSGNNRIVSGKYLPNGTN